MTLKNYSVRFTYYVPHPGQMVNKKWNVKKICNHQFPSENISCYLVELIVKGLVKKIRNSM